MAHSWPGNIRELENVMRKYLVVRDAETILEDLRSRNHRRTAPSVQPNQLKAAAAGASAGLPYDEAPAPPILARVNRAKEEAETDAI